MKMIKLFEAWSQVNEELLYPNLGLDFRPYMCGPQKSSGPLGRQGEGSHNYELIQWNFTLPKKFLLFFLLTFLYLLLLSWVDF